MMYHNDVIMFHPYASLFLEEKQIAIHIATVQETTAGFLVKYLI